MFKHTSKKNKTEWEFSVTIPAADIKAKFDELLESESGKVTVEGFRKGKAPKNMAKKQLDHTKVYEKAVTQILSDVYSEIVKKEGVKPVIQPRVRFIKAKEGEDFELTITIAERPEVTIPDYKKIITEIKKGEKASDIWVPGKDKEGDKTDKNAEQKRVALLNKIFDTLSKKTKIEISNLIVEDEVNRKLTSLLDEVKKLGMTVDDYMRSKNTSIEAVRKAYTDEVTEMYKLEILLEEIANEAKITVEQKDLDTILTSIQDEAAKKQAEGNMYLYASILKRQKTLDYLLAL